MNPLPRNSVRHSPTCPYRRGVVSEPAPSQQQIEEALTQTLRGWCAELDDGRKFWWTDWTRMIGDAVTAVRTGEPVLHDD